MKYDDASSSNGSKQMPAPVLNMRISDIEWKAAERRLLDKLAPEFAAAARELGIRPQGVFGRSRPVHVGGMLIAIRPSGGWFYDGYGGTGAGKKLGKKELRRHLQSAPGPHRG
jgi:hypothetical protein